MTTLREKELVAIQRLKNLGQASSVYVGHSGGKDSVVVHHLAMKAYGNVPVVHTPKITGFNAVHPDTIDFLYQLSATHGLYIVPGSKFKEFLDDHNLDTQVDGTRRDECDRLDRSADVVIDGKTISREEMPVFTVGGVFGQSSIFPIVDWSDDDVWEYIRQEGIAVSKEYPPRPAR